MAHDVFISYPSQEKTVADAVCASLEGRRIRCWIAPRDVLAGRGYAEQIPVAIEGAQAMVLVFSGHANRSTHMMREVEIAINRGIPIVPLRIENVVPEGALDYYLKTIHWLDALSPPLEDHLEKLATSMERLLAREPTETSSSVSNELPLARSTAQQTLSALKNWPIAVGTFAILLILVFAIVAGRGYLFPEEPDAHVPPIATKEGVSTEVSSASALPKDLDRMQGFWTLVATESEGKRESVAEGEFELEFRGDEMWAYERPHPKTGGKLIFRDDMNPRGFEQVFEYQRDGKKFKGRISFIYRFLDEDHLEMATPSDDSFDKPGALFPRGFDTTKEETRIDTYERKRKA